jgi:hypothetical protein
MQEVDSNWVFVVSLGGKPKGWQISFVDTVEKEGRYFHPTDSPRWPKTPPNYIAWRYRGRLQGIADVSAYEIIPDMHSEFAGIPKGAVGNHVLYKLGPTFTPAHVVPTGNIYRSAHAHCMLDTLFTSKFRRISWFAGKHELRASLSQSWNTRLPLPRPQTYCSFLDQDERGRHTYCRTTSGTQRPPDGSKISAPQSSISGRRSRLFRSLLSRTCRLRTMGSCLLLKVRAKASPTRHRGLRITIREVPKVLKRFGVPDGIRTRVIAVKGRCPRPG